MAAPFKKIPNVTLEGVDTFSKNFSGVEAKFNPKGKRNVCVFLPEEVAKDMLANEWPVKWLEPKEEYDETERKAFIKVKVNFNVRPPRIVLISSRGKTVLNEKMLDMLDWVDFVNCDVILNASRYDYNGKQGVTAYAQSIYITIELNRLEEKYYDVPDSAASSLPVSDEPYEPYEEDDRG